jgi:transposase
MHDNHKRTIPAGEEKLPEGKVIPLENGRIAWFRLYNRSGSVKEVCERFQISKKTFYKWLKRYKESGEDSGSLSDRSRRPHRFPKSTPDAVIQLLRQARAETGFGQRRLKAYMAQNHNIAISERTIWKILKRFEVQPLNERHRYY